MTERELADHLFDVARSRARGAGRYFGDGTGHDLLELTNAAARELAAITDPSERLPHLRKAERDLRRFIDMAIDEAANVPNYPSDLLGEASYFPARMRFCPCRPFC